ncbi:MAG: cysteine desulfurase [Rhodospirillales bacterium]|nr:cysteine desulfurase [Alphaproteobacteria bacterium]MCB9981633.1 cysteine desulfurase [Rhodospirillales bacterium]
MIDTPNYRDDFPVLAQTMNGKPLAFLDTAASAQKPRAVIEAMDAVLESGYSNIHRGLYRISQDLTADFESVRAKIARFMGVKSEKEIVFTRNATESINLVAQTWGRTYLKPEDEIILTEMEHHANIVPWQLLQKEISFTIKVIPVRDDGALDLDAFETLLSEKTKLVACVQISNAFGVINPVNKLIELVRKLNPKTKVLIDGSQAIVHAPVNVTELDADFYVFTGHKLYGPTGIGVLYGKSEVLESMPPYQGGGDMIERVSFEGTTFKEPPYRFEAGTPAIVEVIGLGAAIDYVQNVGYEHITAHEAALRNYGHERLKEIDGLKLYGLGTEKTGIFSFTMDCAHPSDIGMILDQCGVAVRAGHHCCMPLMQRFGLDATVRASLGLYSNRQDIDQLVEGLHKVKDMLG